MVTPSKSPSKPSTGTYPLISLDTECTGLDMWHGCKPFFVSTCDEQGVLRYWEWDVDPYTREPIVPKGDLAELRALLAQHTVVLHNAKFDIRA